MTLKNTMIKHLISHILGRPTISPYRTSRRSGLTICGGALLLSFSSYLAAGLPDIGNPEDKTLSKHKEASLGGSFYRAMQQRNLVENDPMVSAYIQSVGNRITSGIGSQKFKFFVVKDNRINAFAVPGGYIGINQGLILNARNEAELASVLAHETAHVTQRHIARFYADIDKAVWMQLGTLLAGIALASQGQSQAGTATIFAGSALSQQAMVTHTRIHELEADRIGIQYLARAGYDPNQMAGFFSVLMRKNRGADQRFEMLRTHPLSINRVAEAKSLAKQTKVTRSTPTVNTKRFTLVQRRLLSESADPIALLRHFEKQKKVLSEADQYTYALLLMRIGELKKAVPKLRTLIKAHPQTVDYQLALSNALIQQKQYVQAEIILDNLSALYPDYAPISLAKAQLYRNKNDFKKSIQAIDSISEKETELDLLSLSLLSQNQRGLKDIPMGQYIQGLYLFNKGEYRASQIQLTEAKTQKERFNPRQLEIMDDVLEKIKEEQRR